MCVCVYSQNVTKCEIIFFLESLCQHSLLSRNKYHISIDVCLFVNSCKLAKIILYIEIQINFIISQVIFGFKLCPTNFQFSREIIGNFCLVDVSGFQIPFYVGHNAFCFMLAHNIKGSSYWWLWNRGWAFFPVTYDDSFSLLQSAVTGESAYAG